MTGQKRHLEPTPLYWGSSMTARSSLVMLLRAVMPQESHDHLELLRERFRLRRPDEQSGTPRRCSGVRSATRHCWDTESDAPGRRSDRCEPGRDVGDRFCGPGRSAGSGPARSSGSDGRAPAGTAWRTAAPWGGGSARLRVHQRYEGGEPTVLGSQYLTELLKGAFAHSRADQVRTGEGCRIWRGQAQDWRVDTRKRGDRRAAQIHAEDRWPRAVPRAVAASATPLRPGNRSSH